MDGIIVLLHGLGGDASAWKWVQSQLESEGYEVVAVDLLGHGAAERLDEVDGYEMERVVSWLEELFLSKQWKHVVLVGHCYGGMLALRLALSGRVDLAGLVLVNTTYRQRRVVRWMRQVGGAWFWKKVAGVLPSSYKEEQRDYEQFVGSGDFSIRRVWDDIVHTSWKSYLAIAASVMKFEVEDASLEQLDVSTLVVAGSKDLVYSQSMAQTMTDLITRAKLRVLDINHVSPISLPGELAGKISRFYQEVVGRD